MNTSRPLPVLQRLNLLFRRTLLLCLLMLVALATSGCPGKVILGGGDGRRVVTAGPLDEARSAYQGGDYNRAETVALRLSSDSSLSRDQSVEANRILAAAALHNGHPSVALTALDQWRTLASGADTNREWQDAWAKAMRALSSHDARTRANEIYQDGSRAPQVRSVAGVVLAVRQWQDGDLGQSLVALENIYASAASAQDKAMLERRLALELGLAGEGASSLAASAVTEDNKAAFPYSIILIDALRRQSAVTVSREAALASLQQLSGQVTLADPSLFQSPPSETSIVIQGGPSAAIPSGPVAGQPVVLALPLSGQLAPIAGKIVAGAQVACDELSAAGSQVSLIVIDTEQADWLARVEGLPANAAVIGGPLRRDDYARAKAQGLTGRRAMFTFLPALEAGDEGHTAWRFFTGARDQVDTLLAFTTRLGIEGYAVFYPEENYGRRMSAMFEERARGSGAKNVVTQGYQPGDQNNWMASARELLAQNKSGRNFRAIFLPDSWKNMDVIVPNFFYYQETRQVLLGTSLWETGLAGGNFVSTQYYNLAVFPGSWNAAQPTPAGQKLQAGLASAGKEGADYWSGLGYDFARLSASLGVGEGWTPDQVNAALQRTSIAWSIAPMHWNAGVATQQMYLFQPTSGGFAPVNEAEFRNAFEQAWR